MADKRGPGRPPSTGPKVEKVSITLYPDQRGWAKAKANAAYGKNLSLFIQTLIERAREQEAA